MTVTKVPPVTTAGREAGIWRLIMAVRNWYRRRHPVMASADHTDVTIQLDNGRYITMGAVPDVDEDEDEDMVFHTTPAVLTVDKANGVYRWEWDQIENPDLADDWKTYEDWIPTTAYIN
jgi:hypothetical protein